MMFQQKLDNFIQFIKNQIFMIKLLDFVKNKNKKYFSFYQSRLVITLRTIYAYEYKLNIYLKINAYLKIYLQNV